MDLTAMRKLLKKWELLGFLQKEDGLYYGVGPAGNVNGWLHAVFAPTTREFLGAEILQFPRLADFSYVRNLQEHNGMQLFKNCLCLDGVSVFGMAPYRPKAPFRLWATNHDYREIACGFDGLIVGGGNLGEVTVVYVQLRDGKILSVDTQSKECLFEWRDIDLFLHSEIARLELNFDEKGAVVDPLRLIEYT